MSKLPGKDNKRERQVKIAEINNALAIILGNAELLQREPGFTRGQKKRLATIAVQVHRITGLLP